MATHYEFQLGSWAYTCEFGCYDPYFPSQIEAERAEALHDCEFQKMGAGS